MPARVRGTRPTSLKERGKECSRIAEFRLSWPASQMTRRISVEPSARDLLGLWKESNGGCPTTLLARFTPSHSSLEQGWQEGRGGPCAFPRRPPGNELFRAELGSGQRSSRELGEDKGLGTFGSRDVAALILSLLYHPQRGREAGHPPGGTGIGTKQQARPGEASGWGKKGRGGAQLPSCGISPGGAGGGSSAPQGAHSGRRRSVEIQSKEGLEEACVCVCLCVCVCVLRSVHSGDPI